MPQKWKISNGIGDRERGRPRIFLAQGHGHTGDPDSVWLNGYALGSGFLENHIEAISSREGAGVRDPH